MGTVARLFTNHPHRAFVVSQVVCVAAAATFSLLGVFDGWFPPPGVAVAIIAVVAAMMSIHPDMEREHRALWLLIIGAFLVVEIFAIAHERTEQSRQQRIALQEEQQHFNEIANGIRSAIEKNDAHFTATMEKSDALVRSSTIAVEIATKNLGEITGGSGFAVIMPDLLFPIHGGTEYALSVYVRGKYPLSDVWIEQVEDRGSISRQQITEFNEGKTGPRAHFPVLPLHVAAMLSGVTIPRTNKMESIYKFSVNARNGITQETLRIRRRIPGDGDLEYSIEIKDGDGKLLMLPKWVHPVFLNAPSEVKPQ